MITGLLQSGRSPKKILDTIQIAAAQVVLEAGEPENFGMPQHCYEYTNTLAWFYGRFMHRHRTKLLYVAGSFVNQAAMKLRNTPGNGRPLLRAPAGSIGSHATRSSASWRPPRPAWCRTRPPAGCRPTSTAATSAPRCSPRWR